MDGFLTTKQLIKQTKVPRETIWSWVRGGYISKPTIARVPKGRGRRALWPLSVVERMRQLRAGSALSLKEIVEKLDRDEAREEAHEAVGKIDIVFDIALILVEMESEIKMAGGLRYVDTATILKLANRLRDYVHTVRALPNEVASVTAQVNDHYASIPATQWPGGVTSRGN